MKKITLAFFGLLLCSFYASAQCGSCDSYFGEKFHQDKHTDLLKRFPKAKKVEWKKCNDSKIHFAFFTLNDTTYSVVYNHDHQWLGTEKRLLVEIKKYDWENEKTIDEMVQYPSPKVFPKAYLPIMRSKDYDFNILAYVNIKKEKNIDAMCDFYTIVLNDSHPLVKKHKTNIFYVSVLDGISLTYTSEKNVIDNFYDFYTEENN